jgi:probable phosphoglycerate mutase
MRLVLIRHAESHHSLRGVIGGPTGCAGLTERGVRQARLLADRLAATGEVNECGVLLCSPWPRASQTAAILAPALPPVSLEEDAGLCELHPGDADGLSWDDYRASFGAFDLQKDPYRPFAPGGESWADFIGRAEATLHRLAERFDGRTVIAVTHAGFVVASFLVLFDATAPRPARRAWLDPVHTALTEWRVSGMTWRLAGYNDAFHLRHQA